MSALMIGDDWARIGEVSGLKLLEMELMLARLRDNGMWDDGIMLPTYEGMREEEVCITIAMTILCAQGLLQRVCDETVAEVPVSD